jgi:hypothetical protein
LAERLAAWEAVNADLAAAVQRYGVRLVARPAGAPEQPPSPEWVLLARGPRWTLYVRRE